jgi:hypothetical protein
VEVKAWKQKQKGTCLRLGSWEKKLIMGLVSGSDHRRQWTMTIPGSDYCNRWLLLLQLNTDVNHSIGRCLDSYDRSPVKNWTRFD